MTIPPEISDDLLKDHLKKKGDKMSDIVVTRGKEAVQWLKKKRKLHLR